MGLGDGIKVGGTLECEIVEIMPMMDYLLNDAMAIPSDVYVANLSGCLSRLPYIESAIYIEGGTSHVGVMWFQQKLHRNGYLLRYPKTTYQNPFFVFANSFRRHATRHWCINRTWTNRIDLDAAL